MRNRSFIAVVAVLAVLFAGAGGLFLYDSLGKDKIAKGVQVAGVDVGGLERDQARNKIESALQQRLAQPIAVRAPQHKSFRLTPRAAGAVFDVGAMVDDAVARSRQGSIFSRSIRSIRGQSVHADLPADVHYSDAAVTRFITGVEKAVNRKPQDASIDFGNGDDISKVNGRAGVVVNARRLRSDVEAAIAARIPNKTVRVRAHETRPKVTRQQLTRQYPVLITINRSAFKLRLWKNLQLVHSYPIAVGQVGLETPAGLYHVQNKAVDPAWNVPNDSWAGSLAGTTIPGGAANNPLKARWLGIFDGAGIHGTAELSSLGSAASHGCIRMAVPDVIALYDQVPVGAPVYIA
ncbi:MAG TPA: L,D-transpeptidase/peptidoglycan binding protein [Solirubrobacteraceae bacterium]|jgi:lipoprotein-anchoring transpeptidase ErfK/SrfK